MCMSPLGLKPLHSPPTTHMHTHTHTHTHTHSHTHTHTHTHTTHLIVFTQQSVQRKILFLLVMQAVAPSLTERCVMSSGPSWSNAIPGTYMCIRIYINFNSRKCLHNLIIIVKIERSMAGVCLLFRATPSNWLWTSVAPQTPNKAFVSNR